MSESSPRITWQQTAKNLFFDDFEQPSKFYETYSESSALYLELTMRLMHGEVTYIPDSGHSAYERMYDAFMEDARTGTRDQLESLVNRYQA